MTSKRIYSMSYVRITSLLRERNPRKFVFSRQLILTSPPETGVVSLNAGHSLARWEEPKQDISVELQVSVTTWAAMCTAMDSPPCSNDTQEAVLSKLDSRKSNKPLMEKKRRQRINRCLNDLKSLVLEGMKKDPSRYSKLEKADILEMTVRHVQALHRHVGVGCRLGGGARLMGSGRPVGSDGRSKYRAGFIHCAVEVTRYLAGLSGVPHDLHHRLISHLNTVTSSLTCVPGVGQLPGASVVVGGGVVTVASPPAPRPDAPPVSRATNPSSSVPHTLGASTSVPCRSPLTAHFPESGAVPPVTSSLPTGTSVALVPTRLRAQQATQVSLSSSFFAAPVQAIQPRVTARSALPVTNKTHVCSDSGLTGSENVPVAPDLQLSESVTLTAPGDASSPNEEAHSHASSSTFTSRILPQVSSGLAPLGERVTAPTLHLAQDEVNVSSTHALTAVKPSHAAASMDAVQLGGPMTPASESHGRDSSSSWAPPQGFQVSVRLSSATSPPVLCAPFWSSPVIVRPMPTLPKATRHPLSSASPLLSPSSLSSSSSSSLSPSPGTSVLSTKALLQQDTALAAPASRERLHLVTNHQQESATGAHLKVISALPWPRPNPYPLPHRLPPRLSQPWRPW